MPLARIRTSDPEVVEFLSRHLASSGYQLEFVRPSEAVHGDADLEIDASRMDIDSAIAAAQQEGGLVTVLRGVLQPERRRDIFEEAAQTQASHDYAEVSPYARGAELEDQPSALHRVAETVVGGIAAGVNSVGSATKTASERFSAWKTQRDSDRAARREQRERELAVEAARRREEEARRAQEEHRRRVEESRLRAEEEERRRVEAERLAVIRREEQARLLAEAQRQRELRAQAEAEEAARREEEERQQAEAAQQRMEEEARLRAEEERHLQEQAQLRAAEERRRAQEIELTGIERQQQEENFSSPQWYQDALVHREEEVQDEAPARAESHEEPAVEHVVEVPVARQWHEAQAPQQSWSQPTAPSRTYRDRRRRLRRPVGERERVFKRAGVAAAIVAVGVITLWTMFSMRRPANPLNQEQLIRSSAVEQSRPFGPATTKAPLTLPTAQPAVRRPAPARRTAQVRARSRASKSHAGKTQTAKRSSDDDGEPEVVVRHFATQKQEQAKVKMKNGIKVISESE